MYVHFLISLLFFISDTNTTTTTLGFAKNLFPQYNASSLFTSANWPLDMLKLGWWPAHYYTREYYPPHQKKMPICVVKKKNKSKLKKTFLLATTFSSLHVLGNIYPNQYFTHALILSSIQSYTWYYNTTEWVHFWVSIIWYVLNFSTHFFWQKSGYHYLLLLLKFSCKSNKYISFGFFCQYFWWEMIKPK